MECNALNCNRFSLQCRFVKHDLLAAAITINLVA